MSEIKVASRYAKSLIDLAVENNSLEEVRNDMDLLERTVDDNPMLEAILKNPIVSQDKKLGILNNLFADKVNKITKSFFSIIVNKGRSEILFGTAKEVVRQYNALKGIVKAKVVSAAPLDDQTRNEIEALIKTEIGANQIILDVKVDEKLIGGFVLTVGDKQYDASIANGLKKIQKNLARA